MLHFAHTAGRAMMEEEGQDHSKECASALAFSLRVICSPAPGAVPPHSRWTFLPQSLTLQGVPSRSLLEPEDLTSVPVTHMVGCKNQVLEVVL